MPRGGDGEPAPALGATLPALSTASALAVEVVITFLLLFVILQTVSRADAGALGAFAIGGPVALLPGLTRPTESHTPPPVRDG